jgi:hypothetical protein
MDNTKIADMDKSIRCLALELPGPVWEDVNNRWQTLKADLPSQPKEVKGGVDKEKLIHELIWIGFRAAQNAYRLYPENKHTFSDHSDYLIKEGLKILDESQSPIPVPDIEEKLKQCVHEWRQGAERGQLICVKCNKVNY